MKALGLHGRRAAGNRWGAGEEEEGQDLAEKVRNVPREKLNCSSVANSEIPFPHHLTKTPVKYFLLPCGMDLFWARWLRYREPCFLCAFAGINPHPNPVEKVLLFS